MIVFFAAIVTTSGNESRAISGLRKAVWIASQSAARSPAVWRVAPTGASSAAVSVSSVRVSLTARTAIDRGVPRWSATMDRLSRPAINLSMVVRKLRPWGEYSQAVGIDCAGSEFLNTHVWLDDVDHHQLYVPEGFAHGFYVDSDVADVAYKVSTLYDPALETGFAWETVRALIEGYEAKLAAAESPLFAGLWSGR